MFLMMGFRLGLGSWLGSEVYIFDVVSESLIPLKSKADIADSELVNLLLFWCWRL